MRDEKEGRKKQARTNKQGKATQHTQGSHAQARYSVFMYTASAVCGLTGVRGEWGGDGGGDGSVRLESLGRAGGGGRVHVHIVVWGRGEEGGGGDSGL